MMSINKCLSGARPLARTLKKISAWLHCDSRPIDEDVSSFNRPTAAVDWRRERARSAPGAPLRTTTTSESLGATRSERAKRKFTLPTVKDVIRPLVLLR